MTIAQHPAAAQQKTLRQLVLTCAQQVDWRDRGQMTEAMDLVLGGRVEVQDEPPLAQIRTPNTTWTLTPDQDCACGEPMPCTHSKAVELQNRVNAALLQPAAPDSWADAVLRIAREFHQAHPEVDQGRLGRGVDLATNHAVAMRTDGSALVSNGGTARPRVYPVGLDDGCICDDVKKRGVRYCKHAIAVELTTRAYHQNAATTHAMTAAAGARRPRGPHSGAEDDIPEPVVPDFDTVPDEEPLPIVLGPPPLDDEANTWDAAVEGYTPPVPATPATPPPMTWAVNEAPAVSWFKWRVGNAELFYSFRGSADREVLDRVQTYMPVLLELVDEAERRREELEHALQELRAKARQAETLTPDMIRDLAREVMHEVVTAARATQDAKQSVDQSWIKSSKTEKTAVPKASADSPDTVPCPLHDGKRLFKNAPSGQRRNYSYSHRQEDHPAGFCDGTPY